MASMEREHTWVVEKDTSAEHGIHTQNMRYTGRNGGYTGSKNEQEGKNRIEHSSGRGGYKMVIKMKEGK